MLLQCLILGFVSLSVFKAKTVLLKKLSKLLLMCLTFHIRVGHFFDMPKKKSIYTKYLCLLSQLFFPGLPNLEAKIRCIQNRYTGVQTDLKYPQQLLCIFTLNILFFMVYQASSHQSQIFYILSYHPSSSLCIPNHE